MARRKKINNGKRLIVGVILLFFLLSAIQSEAWLGAVICIALLLLLLNIGPPVKDTQRTPKSRATRSDNKHATMTSSPTLIRSAPASAAGFRIPKAPAGFGKGEWIPAGESITVAGTTIPGGMIYVGTGLTSPSGEIASCLINPSCPVAKEADFRVAEMGYWPSYSTISAKARRAYLDWLAGGRQAPDANIGYVFLFFYGLEYRTLIDTPEEAERSQIAAELRRLIRIYGSESRSFRRYAIELLAWVELTSPSDTLYTLPLPDFPRSGELPMHLRLALGQAVRDKEPITPSLALAWVRHSPLIELRTPAIRCRVEFDTLFKVIYAEKFGEGMQIPINRTVLKFSYRPAASGFYGFDTTRTYSRLGDVPDVTVLTNPLKHLQKLVDKATARLDSYSRLLARSPELADHLEGWLLLPTSLWPSSATAALEDLRARMGDGALLLTYDELLTVLSAHAPLSRDKTLALVRILEILGFGVEPDVLESRKTLRPDDRIVLFAQTPDDNPARTTAPYRAALLTLQLASSVATADGEFSQDELTFLREQVGNWTHLVPALQRRLRAHLELLVAEPMTLTGLKTKVEPLNQGERKSIAAFVAAVAHSDGMVSPAEVKLLERIYRALGLEAKNVFSDLHAAASGETSSGPRAGEGFTLDPARIAALQQETKHVSALLSGIFSEDEGEPEATEPEVIEAEIDEGIESETILDLDETHSALARLLLSRPTWRRSELENAAADLELMLDGALEQLNEAAYDVYDMPFTEGDDPIEVSAEIVESLAL